jgi:alanine racemase
MRLRPATIYILDGFLPGCGERLDVAGLTPVLSTLPQVSAATASTAGRSLMPVALQVDTGMNRQGLTLAEARTLSQAALAGLDPVLLMSHLGSAAQPDDPRSAEQLARFEAVRSLFPGVRTSLAASAGAFLGPDYRGDVVRPGIVLYGGGPQERPDPRIRAVATLAASILDIRSLQPGDRVGYGETFTAERAMRVAVVGAGYADGLLRATAGAGYAWLAGARRRLLAVTMDLLVIELGETPANVGDPVELLGPNVCLDDLAAAARTAPHEILVRLSPRAERVYLGES